MSGSPPAPRSTLSTTQMPGIDMQSLLSCRDPQRVNASGAQPRKIPVPAQAQDSCWPAPLAGQAGEEEGHTIRLLGIPECIPNGEGRVPLGVDRNRVKQVQDKSLDRSDVFIFLFS